MLCRRVLMNLIPQFASARNSGIVRTRAGSGWQESPTGRVMHLKTVTLIGLLCSGTSAFGQDSLALSSGSTTQGGTTALNLSLTSPAGSEPAGIQWTFAYSSSDIVSITAAAGPAATAAGKSVVCAGIPGSYTCLLTGVNASVVSDGVAATVSVTLSPTVTGSTPISVTNTIGASLAGSAIALAGAGATITVTGGIPPGLAVTSVQCNPLGLSSRVGSSCTVTLNQPAPSNITAVLSCNNSAVLNVPSSVVVAAGTSSTTFSVTAATVTTGQIVLVTATLGTSSQTGSVAVLPPLAFFSLACSASLIFGGNGTCIVTMNRNVYQNRTITITTNGGTALLAPPSVILAIGNSSSAFSITAGNVAGQYVVTVSSAGLSESAAVSVIGGQSPLLPICPLVCLPPDLGPPQTQTRIKPVSLSCNPRAAQAGDTITCEVQLNSAQIPEGLRLRVASSSREVKVPATVTTRPMQSSLSFQGYTSPNSKQQSAVLQVALGADTAQDSVIILPSRIPVHVIPGRQIPKPGSALGFPSVPYFDPLDGRFNRIGDQSQMGNDPGPVVTALVNGASQSQKLACSPGAIASLAGSWLVRENLAWSEPAGNTTELGGTAVTLNGDPVPVLYASGTRVDFLCPSLAPGIPILVRLENRLGKANPIAATMLAASPGIFTIDGSGNGLGAVLFPGTSAVATVRNPVVLGEPAQPGDNLAVRVTGVPTDAVVYVQLGDVRVPGYAIQTVAGRPGVYEVLTTVPAGVVFGDAVPVRIQVISAGGGFVESNVVTMAIEPVRP